MMGNLEAEYVVSAQSVCTNCVHREPSTEFCLGTEQRKKTHIIDGSHLIEFYHPKSGDYLNEPPKLREVNLDGHCAYYKKKSGLAERLRRYIPRIF